jgi:hypothetical protein
VQRLRLWRAHLIGWWRARRAPPPPPPLKAADLAPAFTALAFFFRPAALIAGALYVHERAEYRRERERALRRARIAWGAIAVSMALLLALSLVR